MSAEKTLEILDLFTPERRELSVQEISQLLNQPQSSVYRHLRVLKEKGLVRETNGGLYKLGYRLLEMANIVRMDNGLVTVALPVMRQLTQEIGETSILIVASGLQAVCLETVPSSHPIKVSSERGKIIPLYGGASSKALLAYMKEEIVDELFRKNMVQTHTANTIVDPQQLKADLQQIRERGYAVSDQEIDEGVFAYGVPIRDAQGQVIASLSIAGPRDRMLAKDEKALIDNLQSAANEIQKYL
ncbi:IclR family transcriptional regulator [Brevibacillus marinus]|uniref:IclR family transcriptional regulator n=1 Tax=Brevibacillus marinus TaxID=2496837 RepID=UPI0013DEB413|nr:IclR family transcriptional regulator [Brevibacillus marinus]